jgi:hypothetical protein
MVIKEADNRFGQGCRLARRHQESMDAVLDEPEVAPDCRGNDRLAGGHVLQEGV